MTRNGGGVVYHLSLDLPLCQPLSLYLRKCLFALRNLQLQSSSKSSGVHVKVFATMELDSLSRAQGDHPGNSGPHPYLAWLGKTW